MGLGTWVSSKYKRTKEKLSACYDKAKSACSKTWNGFTGKKYTDEANALLDDVERRYESAKKNYEDHIARYSSSIEQKILTINRHKQALYQQHFIRFMELAKRLHNVTVKGQPFMDFFADDVLHYQVGHGVRSRDDIMLIDFEKMNCLETFAMVFTLGIFSRKKAKESLEQAKQEQARIEEEIVKMQAQQTKVKVIDESIDNVVIYFDQLITNYGKLLDRFEYGIQTQRLSQLSQFDSVIDMKLDFRLLPVVHLEEFRALFNLSLVLKQMANMSYLNESGELIDQDCQQASHVFELVQRQSMVA